MSQEARRKTGFVYEEPSWPGIQSVPASGTRAIAAASTVSATRSSGSRLWTCDFPQARASVCVSSVRTRRKFAIYLPPSTGSKRAASSSSWVEIPTGSRPAW